MPSSNAPHNPPLAASGANSTEPANVALGLPESDWRTVVDRELSAALASFAAGVAHEARNQIFAVTATLDALEARFKESSERPPHFGVMREDLQRLTTLMHGLAEFGHPSAPVLAFGQIKAAALDALSATRPSAERKKVELHSELEDERATAWFDRERLSLALRNLLEHAVRRSPEAEPVKLTISRGDGEEGLVTVTIVDNGPALGSAHLERFFEPFFSPNRAARGLDLALAKRIIEQHGGSLRAQNCGALGLRLEVLVPGSGG